MKIKHFKPENCIENSLNNTVLITCAFNITLTGQPCWEAYTVGVNHYLCFDSQVWLDPGV